MGIKTQDNTLGSASVTSYPFENNNKLKRQPAIDENLMAREFQNLLNASGQTSSQTDPRQIEKAISMLVANSNLYTTSGTANAIILTAKTINSANANSIQMSNLHFDEDGAKYEFVANFTNTGAVTGIITGFLTAQNIVDINGTALTTGSIINGRRYTLIRDKVNNRFILQDSLSTLLQSQKPIILTYVNATTINYSAGGFTFDDYTGVGSVTAGTINLATNGIGGLDQGSLAANTTYFLHGYKNNITGAFGVAMSTSATTSIITDWTRVARIRGAVLITNASSQIIEGTWYKDGKFEYNTPIESLTNFTQASSAETLRTLNVPSGIQTRAIVRMSHNLSLANTGTKIASIYSPQFTRTTLGIGDFTNFVLYDASSGLVSNQTSGILEIATNISAQVKTNARQMSGSADMTLSIVVYGWIDNIN